MTAAVPPPAVAELLAESQWVRGLARSLVADVHAAEDLAQDACVVALDRPPMRADNLRSWLRTVMQNLVRQSARASRRRTVREQTWQGGHPGSSEATDDLVARAGAHRAVVDAVLSLDQPFRDTVLLRYFEDLAPRAIAARMQVPEATVHSRLQRGHAQIRLRLDRDSGGRGRWLAALAPFTTSPPAVLAPLGLFAMNMKLLSVAGAITLGSAVLWYGLQGTVPDPAPVTPIVATDATAQRATVPRAADMPDGTRVDVSPPPASRSSTPTPTRGVSGKLVDADGNAVANTHVRFADVRVVSDPSGAFASSTTSFDGLPARVDEPGWQTVMEGVVRAGPNPPPVLVVTAPAVRLRGQVRDDLGMSVVGAALRAVWPPDLRARLRNISDGASEQMYAAQTTADGAFALDGARVRGAELLVVADGCIPHRRPFPANDDAALTIELTRLTSQPGTVRGQVVDPHGRAIAGARVGLGREVTKTDEQGNFALPDDQQAKNLAASAPQHRRGIVERGAGGFTPFVVLTLGSTPLTIAGRVVDENGKGLAGIVIWPANPTGLCASRELMVVEGIACGFDTAGDLRSRFERGEFAGKQPQQVMRETPTAMWPWVRTDADGAFTLTGLEDRPYRLRAMDDDTLLMTQTSDLVAGARDVRIVLDQSQLFAEVRGVVVTRNGSPVRNVRVKVQIDTQSMDGNTLHGQAVATATTDEHGVFSLPRVPKASAYFRVDGDDILPSEPGRGMAGGILDLAAGRPTELRLEVRQRMHVQVELLDVSRADAISALDDHGKAVMLTVFLGRGRNDTDRLQLQEGRSPVFVLPDTAATLLLMKGDMEVARHALQLRAGDVNTLRL